MSLERAEPSGADAYPREDERLFRAIFSQSPVGIAQTSLRGDWLLVNKRLCEILGYSPPELPGKTLLDITHSDDREPSLTAFRQLLSGEIALWSKEKRFIRKDGATVWARVFTSLVRDQHDQPQYFITAVEDMTDKIQAERALRDSEQRLTMAQNAAYLGVWDRDMRTDVITIFGKYAELHGLSPDRTALRHEEWVSLIHPDDRERVDALRREAREHTHPFEAEFRVIWPEGSVHWLHAKGIVLLGESGRPIRSMGVIWEITERKQAEARLRESEERFRHMADSAPVMIWESGLDKLCTFFNQPWLDFTGRTMEEELGNGWASGVHPEDLDLCLVTYNSSFDARRSFQMEYRLRRADGEYRWVLDNGTPLYRGDEFVGFIGSCIDISEQKLIEERLRASEIQLLDAQRLAKLGSFERQIDTGRAHWSDELRQIFGVTRDAAAGFPAFINCVHPKDRERMLEIDDKARSSIAPVEAEYRIIRPDGELRFVRSIVEAIRDDQGVPVRITGATQDITDQVKGREVLREREGYLKNATRLARLGYWQWDLQTNRISGSDEMLRIFGKPPNYAPSYDDFLQTVIPEDRERVARWVSDCLAEKRGGEIEYQIAWPNGDLRTVSEISEFSLGEDGLPTRRFGACQDITDLRRAQRENLARQKLESIGTLAGGIAHDFNNLLAGVLAEAELAATELMEGEAALEGLQRIRLAAGRGAEIVRELMTYSGQDKGGPVEPVDLSRLLEEMLELLKISVSKHAVLKVDLQKKLPPLRGNAAQIRQIVMNIIINASEAIGEKDGVIKVTASHVVLPRNSGPDLPSGDYVNLEISDTGCGMTQEVQAKVFDPFFSTKFAGRGLGLAVVQGIVRDHDGAVNLVSAPGQGTTFEIFLPCGSETPQSRGDAMEQASAKERGHRTWTVLVVEDEGVLRGAVSKMLRKNGFGVIEAGDGSSALDLVRAYKDEIDVMLLDITLPGVSSREVFEQAQRLRPNLKVIITSAYVREAVDASFAGLRVEHFIRKPFQFTDLLGLLQDASSA